MKKQKNLAEDNDPELKAKGSPLMCWDIVMDGYHRIMRLMEDAKKLNQMAAASNWKHRWNFSDKILREGNIILVTKPDITIQFATENMYSMNGYMPFEVVGKTPRIFQGEATEVMTKELIRKAVQKQESFVAELANYKKNGEIYRCSIEGHPLFNSSGKLVNFIAFEKAS